MVKRGINKSTRQNKPPRKNIKSSGKWSRKEIERLSKIISQSLLSQYIETIQQTQKRIQESFAIPAVRLAEQRSQITAAAEEINKSLTASMEPVVKRLQEQQQIFTQLFETASRIRERHERACEAFRESGWFFAPSLNDMPVPAFDNAIRSFYEGDKDAVTSLLINYYSKNNHEKLEQTVESWVNNPLFASRMQIIRDALEVHKKGKYTLTIPTLLPLTEGIAREFLLQEGINDWPRESTSGRRLIPEAVRQGTENSYFSISSADVLIWWIQNVAFEDTRNLEVRGPNFGVLNRHNVLHGFQLDYANEDDSLRLFLTLDGLFALKHTKRA